VRSVQPFMQQAGMRVNDQRLWVIVSLMQDRIRTYSDLPVASTFFFHPPRQFDHSTIKKKWNGSIKAHYLSIVEQVKAITIFKSELIKEMVSTCITGAQLKF